MSDPKELLVHLGLLTPANTHNVQRSTPLLQQMIHVANGRVASAGLSYVWSGSDAVHEVLTKIVTGELVQPSDVATEVWLFRLVKWEVANYRRRKINLLRVFLRPGCS